MDKEVQWRLIWVQIRGDGSKPRTMKAIALELCKILRVTTISILPPTRRNQLEVQPILDKIFKTLAQEKSEKQKQVNRLALFK